MTAMGAVITTVACTDIESCVSTMSGVGEAAAGVDVMAGADVRCAIKDGDGDAADWVSTGCVPSFARVGEQADNSKMKRPNTNSQREYGLVTGDRIMQWIIITGSTPCPVGRFLG
jgi:hypothetical protein